MPQKVLTYEDAIKAGGTPLTYEDAIKQGGKPADVAELRATAAHGVGENNQNFTQNMTAAQIAGNQFLNVLEGMGIDPQSPILGTVRNFIKSGGEGVQRIADAPISGTIGVAKDIAMAPVNAISNIMTADNVEQQARGAGEFLASTPVAAAELKLAKGAAKGAASALPSKARAGAKLQAVDTAAGTIPINTVPAQDVVARARELEQAGATIPKVLNKFEQRTTGPKALGQPALTYSEGRDFAKNSGRLSATESMASNPEMKMLTGKFYDAMKNANREAAAKVGMEKIYDSAIKEFRQASTISEAMEVAAKWAKIAAVTGAIGATGAKLYKGLMEP